jgi:hypothetical protein
MRTPRVMSLQSPQAAAASSASGGAAVSISNKNSSIV